jgi:hypothetical protein
MEISPSEVRIEHSVADQIALRRAFTRLYAALAAVGLVVAAFVDRAWLLGAAFFAVFVAWWAWRIRRTQAAAVPWVVVLTPDELRHTHQDGDVRVLKAEAGEVQVADRAGPRMRLHVLEVKGHQGEELVAISLPGRNEATALEASFEEWGWPLSARRR